MQKPAESTSPLSAAQRRFLYLTAVINGAAIMVIEILGAKMLAPFLGTSHFVWTAQIGIAMASLATGYYLGGRWADGAASLSRLYAAMLAAAGYLCLAVAGLKFVATKCLAFSLPIGSLLASTFLFFVPLSLLAMTCPFLVRFITEHLRSVGGIVGRLTALSTVGSLVGTALIGYLLIPLAPNSVTMTVTAIVVALIAVAHFVAWGRRSLPAAAVGLGIVVLGWFASQQAEARRYSRAVEIYRRNSDFGLLEVMETRDGRYRLYLNDYLNQNALDTRTGQSTTLFTYALHGLATIYTERLESVLCIGVGVGIVPRLLAAAGTQVDAVEINRAVLPIAERFFEFDPTKLRRLVIGDGRQFLNGNSNRYDAVMLDAFLGDSSPSHLMTREAFTAMRAVLQPEGVLVINCFGDSSTGRNYFVGSLQKTLRAVFPHVQLHASGNGNMFFLASPSPLVRRRAFDVEQVHSKVRIEASVVLASPTQPIADAAGIVLTDDFNPVEYHDAANREHFRRLLAESVRDL